ncbi:MAG: DUF5399 family protein [Chlamydiales bacterium]|nr:DUF5399 family protein [Chlamydiales bacterium]
MSLRPKTIDNLGVEAYTRYAEDEKLRGDALVKDAHLAPSQAAEVDVTTPSYASEFDALFGISKRNAPWADFSAPPKFHEQKRRLFTHQILPSLGTADKKEVQSQRIIDLVETTKKRKETMASEGKETLQMNREFEEEESEKKVLLNALNRISTLERTLIDINSRRGQYHKG